jgi:LacI family transcriptional regulator
MHAGGASIRRIARDLAISPQTVSNWMRTMPTTSAPAPSTPPPTEQPLRPRHTIADVARHAGVSTSTVSNYLNDKGRMSHETRQRIGDAMKALYFTPNALVRAIRNRQTHTLGLLTYGIYELDRNVEFSIVPPILSAINGAADAANYDVLLYTGWPHRARSRTGSDFLNGQIDGLLIMSPQVDNQQIRIASAGGLPVVSLLSRRVPAGAGYVVADNTTAIRETVLYLASRGHTRIALLAAMFTSDFLDRIAGYREGLAAAGIPHDPEIEWTGVRPEEWSEAGVVPVVDRWLHMSDRPTAIVAIDDTLASLSVDRVRERGLRVPEDVAVTGFNDLPAAERMSGGITTVHQPLREIGRVAVERLVAMINGTPVSECRVTLPTTLVIRASTES